MFLALAWKARNFGMRLISSIDTAMPDVGTQWNYQRVGMIAKGFGKMTSVSLRIVALTSYAGRSRGPLLSPGQESTTGN